MNKIMESVDVIEEINIDDLYLRKVSIEDASFFHDSLREKIMTKFLSLGPLKDIDHSKKLIKNYQKYWKEYIQYNYIIEKEVGGKRNNVGSISIWNISWLHRRAEIGIWINLKYWNQGIGKKAINLIKNIAFIHLKLNRLEAHIAIDNQRSIKLFKTCDFKEEGILKKYFNFEGTFSDAVLIACLNNITKNEK